MATRIERFLDEAGFDRGPWLAVGFAGGIVGWFALANRWQWAALVALAAGLAAAAAVLIPADGRTPYLRRAIVAMGITVAAGCLTVWGKSTLAGTPPIAHPAMADGAARILAREDEPAYGQTRLWLALREPRTGRAIRVRVALPAGADPALAEGAIVHVRARLMPPPPPLVPGARDMAREAWFAGLAATGRAIGPVAVLRPAPGDDWLARARHALAAHVLARVPGSAGGIAATLVSGDRGGIAAADQQAMRDAGLTHLLAISGLHVSAVVGGAWFVLFRLLALWPWLALRVRLPLVATGGAAAAGIGYTLITGAHLPTVRACTGALLVLAGMALGRRPLNMRLLAVAAVAVMLLWPEAVIDPSFQMSFGSVIAIIALHEAAPVHAFLADRAAAWWQRLGREAAMLLLAGMVIDLALMPVSLYHFHRAGLYGALANSFAIPLVTFVAMPLIALALLLDASGLGVVGIGGMTLAGVAWDGVGQTLGLLLRVTHWIVVQRGAIATLPAMRAGGYALFVAGMLWLGLWRGRVRLIGLLPALAGVVLVAMLRPPDVLVTGDGRNLGVIDRDGRLLLLREGRSAYTRDLLREVEGIDAAAMPLATWPGTVCNRDSCRVDLARGGRVWRILVLRAPAPLPSAALAPACAAVDIVVAPGKIYGPCQPAVLRADREIMLRTGGLALDLGAGRVDTVADSEGEHPWWRAPHRLPNETADFSPDATAPSP